MNNKHNGYIMTYTGRHFTLKGNDPKEICIEDIAVALSKICRFTGHIKRNEIYSVAQHSIIVSKLAEAVNPKYALIGLLHDATEAYLGDVASPLKAILPEYKELEEKVWERIANKFRLQIEMPGAIKKADRQALYLEKRLTAKDSKWPIFDGVAPPRRKDIVELINPISVGTVQNMFLERFHILYEKHILDIENISKKTSKNIVGNNSYEKLSLVM